MNFLEKIQINFIKKKAKENKSRLKDKDFIEKFISEYGMSISRKKKGKKIKRTIVTSTNVLIYL